jgi:rubrerythrin
MDDLISRAALLKSLNEQAPKPTTDDLYTVNLCIINAPAVDAAPVVQGEWVEEPDRRGYYHCSNCGVVWGVSAKAMKYCPNCTAKMMNSPMWEVDG